jgi:hypothetical protein
MTRIKQPALVAGLLSLAAVASIAQPAPDPMAGYYGNHLKIELTSGYWTGVRVFSPDHSYRDAYDAEGEKGTATGHWSVEDGKICTKADESDAKRFCNLGLGKKPGDTWMDADPYTGNPVRFTLEAGAASAKP